MDKMYGQMTDDSTLRNWVTTYINKLLSDRGGRLPLIIWCDPLCYWREILKLAYDGSKDIELWDDELDELILRERLFQADDKPRIVWIPSSMEELDYLIVYQLQATATVQETMLSCLESFGVDVDTTILENNIETLPASCRQWFDLPRRTLSKRLRQEGSELVSDDELMDYLSLSDLSFSSLKEQDTFGLLCRRLSDDFGLPVPKKRIEKDLDNIKFAEKWRVEALATLFSTEAAEISPERKPPDTERIIRTKHHREKALRLLRRMKENSRYIPHFERRSLESDQLIGLDHWVTNLDVIPPPLSSPIAENRLLESEMKQYENIESLDELVGILKKNLSAYSEHANAFWGNQAKDKVPWSDLVNLAEIATQLAIHRNASKSWERVRAGVSWYIEEGWKIDNLGESLFIEHGRVPQAIIKMRHRLRKVYQRLLDDVNIKFSQLISTEGIEAIDLQFSGEYIEKRIDDANKNNPIAVLILDGCRYDLGNNLVELINEGEPEKRARIHAVRAPLPSMTFIGMPFTLPISSNRISVKMRDKPDSTSQWHVSADGDEENLCNLDARKQYLRNTYKLKPKAILDFKKVIDGTIKVRSHGSLIFVFGKELDTDGHNGMLNITRATEHLERYHEAIRRLLEGGYTTIIVVTDHGFIQWKPEEDEFIEKPQGNIFWQSRRAMVGQNLEHKYGISLKVSSSELDCVVPRSVNAFRSYGRLGFFHGGASLQELIIPVILAQWPHKTKKILGVITRFDNIESLEQRIEIRPGGTQQVLDPSGDKFTSKVQEKYVSREIIIKVVDKESGTLQFKSNTVRIEPGGGKVHVFLTRVDGTTGIINQTMEIRLLDADTDEIIDRFDVTLKKSYDEWD